MDEERRTICDECGSWCPTWFAPNAVWNLAIGGPAATDDPGGILCPSCFIAKAEVAGIVPSAWFLTPDENGAALETLQIIADWPDAKMTRSTCVDMRALARTIIRATKAKGLPAMSEQTFWNYQPTPARKVRVIVGPSPHKTWWCAELEGAEREAVEVTYGGQRFYLDNEDGEGWRKVTIGRGGPDWGHGSLPVASVIGDQPRV